MGFKWILSQGNPMFWVAAAACPWLLEAAGVDTVKELRRRNPANLTAKMAEVNEAKNLSGRAPTQTAVSGWIQEAKETGPKVTY